MASDNTYGLNIVSVRFKEKRTLDNAPEIKSPDKTRELIESIVPSMSKDFALVAYINNRGVITNASYMTQETLKEAIRYPKELVRQAFLSNAIGMIIFQNDTHKDFRINKSVDTETQHLTDKLGGIGALIGIKLYDHVIFDGHKNYLSFLEQGMLIQPTININSLDKEEHKIDTIYKNGLIEDSKIKLTTEKTLYSNKPIETPQDAINLLKEDLQDRPNEHFAVLSLDENNKPINAIYACIGNGTNVILSPNEIFKAPLLSNANSIIMFHNHPSGDPQPSADDMDCVERMTKVSNLIGIKHADHIIFGENNYFSFAEHEMCELENTYTADIDTNKSKVGENTSEYNINKYRISAYYTICETSDELKALTIEDMFQNDNSFINNIDYFQNLQDGKEALKTYQTEIDQDENGIYGITQYILEKVEYDNNGDEISSEIMEYTPKPLIYQTPEIKINISEGKTDRENIIKIAITNSLTVDNSSVITELSTDDFKYSYFPDIVKTNNLKQYIPDPLQNLPITDPKCSSCIVDAITEKYAEKCFMDIELKCADYPIYKNVIFTPYQKQEIKEPIKNMIHSHIKDPQNFLNETLEKTSVKTINRPSQEKTKLTINNSIANIEQEKEKTKHKNIDFEI